MEIAKWISEHRTTFKNDEKVKSHLVIEGDGSVVAAQLMSLVGFGVAIGLFKWKGFLAVVAIVALVFILDFQPKNAEDQLK